MKLWEFYIHMKTIFSYPFHKIVTCRWDNQPFGAHRPAGVLWGQREAGRLRCLCPAVQRSASGHPPQPWILRASEGGALCQTVGHHLPTAPLHQGEEYHSMFNSQTLFLYGTLQYDLYQHPYIKVRNSTPCLTPKHCSSMGRYNMIYISTPTSRWGTPLRV